MMKAFTPSAPTVVLGSFDGVHLGHRALLRSAAEQGGPVIVYTFSTLPHAAAALTLPADRERLLSELGADEVVFDSFDSVRALTPEQFVDRVLIDRLGAKGAVCGFNYRFGAAASGDAALLSALLAARGRECLVVEAVREDGAPISSSRIRALVQSGEMERAEALLGRPFFYRLPVLQGKQLGRRIGIPTANQRIPASLVTPPSGVYAAVAAHRGRLYPAVTNLGMRPTVNTDAADITLESHLIGFEGDLYGEELTVSLLSHLRPESRFPDLAALRAQIDRDMHSARSITQRYLARRSE